MAAAAGDPYWIVACSAAEQGREAIYSILRSRVQKNNLASDTAVLDVPLALKFGSFDDLIRMGDDLIKQDSICEQVVRRLERQVLEIDPSAELRVIFQRNQMSVDQYLHRFTWDDAKYPKSRPMRDNIEVLISAVTHIDDEVRIKSAAFNETKQSHATASKKDASTFIQRDLIDVLTPENVIDSDFIETEHLTTVVVVVPNGSESSWQNSYESLDPFVVPRSTKKFAVSDKEGNTLWKCILFKSSVGSFKNACRPKRFTVREFKYNPNALSSKLEERSKLDAEKNKQESFMSRVCLASFSDACIAWVHIKAMRVFVEATLRFGVPPNFATFLIKPCHNKEKKLRKELNDIFTTKGMFGRAFVENDNHNKQSGGENTAALGAEFGDDEYYPYVSLSFTPFAIFTQKTFDKLAGHYYQLFLRIQPLPPSSSTVVHPSTERSLRSSMSAFSSNIVRNRTFPHPHGHPSNTVSCFSRHKLTARPRNTPSSSGTSLSRFSKSPRSLLTRTCGIIRMKEHLVMPSLAHTYRLVTKKKGKTAFDNEVEQQYPNGKESKVDLPTQNYYHQMSSELTTQSTKINYNDCSFRGTLQSITLPIRSVLWKCLQIAIYRCGLDSLCMDCYDTKSRRKYQQLANSFDFIYIEKKLGTENEARFNEIGNKCAFSEVLGSMRKQNHSVDGEIKITKKLTKCYKTKCPPHHGIQLEARINELEKEFLPSC